MLYLENRVDEGVCFVIPIGDLHYGDPAFKKYSLNKLKGYIKWIKENKNARVILGGDLFNCATRESKTTPFENKPNEFEDLVELFEPIKSQIVGAIRGNHENRYLDYANFDITNIFCQRLGIPYMGASGVICFKVKKEKDGFYRHNYFFYIHHTCFDNETELLTKSGWKKREQLIKGEEVLTLNLATNILEWNKINDKFEYTDFDRMIHMKTKTADLMITENHTLIDRNRKSGKYIKKEAIKFFGKDLNIPANGINNNKEYNIDDNLLKILCWVITEGTNFKGKKHEVRITQSDKPKVDHYYILDLIKEYDQTAEINVRKKYNKGWMGGIFRNYDAYEIYINKCELSKKIRELIPDKKIPQWFFELSKRQFDIVLHELLLGDGTWDKRIGCNNFSYSQKDKNDIDRLQALCCLNGYRTVLSIAKNRFGQVYRLSITTRKTHRIKKQAQKIVKYKGIAWCVSVNNGTLVMRRNGKVSITGNTGGGATQGSKINRVEKLSQIVEGCDAYLGFHSHGLIATPVDIYYPTIKVKKPELQKRRVWYICCGSYLEWSGSYAEDKMLRPQKLGSPRIRLNGGKNKDIHLSI